jgi:iron-sulfur cluster repair protein YtfE (RIC family)
MDTLAAALEREHREIDAGVEAFLDAEDADAAETASLTRALAALRRHIYLEEAFLFPPLRDAGLVAPIFVMLREHGELWRTMAELEGERTAHARRGLCRQLLAQLEKHNSKEEPILYPHADTALPADADAELRAFLASGRTPDGWVCSGARP